MPIFNKDTRTEYHLITCNHPIMIDMGMSSFTLPEFLQWWNYKNSKGKFVNQIPFEPNASAYGISTLLGISQDYVGYDINAWRFEDYNLGGYQKYSILNGNPQGISQWEYYNNNPDANDEDKVNYTFSSLGLERFIDKTFNRITRELEDDDRLESSYVTDLIAMNDYYNILGFDVDPEGHACKKLVQDIRRSKNSGYISWENKVRYFIDFDRYDNEVVGNCEREETFTFKLYLYDSKRPTKRTKSQAFPEINIAAPALGPDGVNNKGKTDGDSDAVVDDSPRNKVGGKLKTSYRAYDGQFAAGSEQIYGIVYSDVIPGTTFSDDMVDWAENMDIEEQFKDPQNNQLIVPGTGWIIPIDMQNGNPFQWAPNYANPRGCREGDKTKVKLRAFNMNSAEFKKGDTVVLSDRYSLWFIDPLASGGPAAGAPRKTPRGWQFTYHLTNEPHFFRFADAWVENEDNYDKSVYKNPKVFHDEAEESLAKKYRRTGLSQNDWEDYLKGLTNEEKSAGTAWPGYAQLTSWDYMCSAFAGQRSNSDGNALVLTASNLDHKGDDMTEIFNDYGTIGRARFTAPFFGCVFPDGYDLTASGNKYERYNGFPYAQDENGQPVIENGKRVYSGSGWKPNSFDLPNDDSFFNQSALDYFRNENQLGFRAYSGIFDPYRDFNNNSTNISPKYFFVNPSTPPDLPDDGVGPPAPSPAQTEPHCNMFSDTRAMKHLPADIGVNGSFAAQYGGPILSLNKVQEYITTPDTGVWSDKDKLVESFHDFWLDSGSFQWLWNTIDYAEKSGVNDPDNSLLDLKPNNISRVEFRPARDIHFAQFDPPQNGTLPHPALDLANQGFQYYTEVSNVNNIGGIIGASNYGGSSELWSANTRNRLKANDAQEQDEGLIIDRVSDTDTVMPFAYGPYSDGSQEWDSLTTNWQCPYSNLYGSNTPNNAFYGSSVNSKSRGAFSVIGAMCTATMTQGLNINADCFIGQPMWFLSNVFYASWGGRGRIYHSPNSTALYLKIYESWPRDQTIYDSRFYAVHHFNDGNRLPIFPGLSPNSKKRPWEKGYEYGDYEIFEGSGYRMDYFSKSRYISSLDVEYNLNGTPVKSGIPIRVNQTITNVDHRVPSILDIDFNDNKQPNPLRIGTLDEYDGTTGSSPVFKEGVQITSSTEFPSNYALGDGYYYQLKNYLNESDEGYAQEEERIKNLKRYTPLLPMSMWNVDGSRRGRLLPWTYTKTVIVPDDPKIIDFSKVKPEYKAHEIRAMELGSIIVAASGEGYEVNDEFIVNGGSGSGARYKVTEVGPVGNPTAFDRITETVTVLDQTYNQVAVGEGYLQTDFISGEASGITNATTSPLRLVPAVGTNRSFRGYIIFGKTYKSIGHDFKPRIATAEKEPQRVSAPDNVLTQTGSITWRDTMDVEIIPIGTQPVALGDGTAFIAAPGLDNVHPQIGMQQTTMLIDLDQNAGANSNVKTGDYDLFFLCVSDATHQWIEAQGPGAPVALENYINMEIAPF